MSSQKPASCFRSALVILIVVLCLVGAAGIAAADRLPKMAAEKFGPPGRSLDITQRVLYSARVLADQNALLTPVDAQGEPRDFEVALGESVGAISSRLEQERLISSANAFRTYLVYAGLDTGVQAGKYKLSPGMTTVQIARELQDAVPEEVEFNILPGWRAEEIAASLPTSGLEVSPTEFMVLVRNPPADLLPQDIPDAVSLEGYLMPGAYQIKRGISAHALVALFIQRFNESITPELRDGFAAHGLDLPQAITLASMVEREAIVADEQPIIASVFYNRIAQGMKFDSDPTVQYALGYNQAKKTWWKNPLSSADLQIDSRYNTYAYTGLPPGPICNPSLNALQAVAAPAQTGYFYFRAKCDGSRRHAFSVTYEEHVQNACP